MKHFTIYLDTSIISFLFADDAPERRDLTQEFFVEFVSKGLYTVYISPVVVDEINRTTDDAQRSRLLNAIKEYAIPVLDITTSIAEIQRLAECYIDRQIIPRKKIEDALHIAISTVYEMDVLLSWNYRHLANLTRERKVLSVNIQEGYMKALRIVTPLEVISDETS